MIKGFIVNWECMAATLANTNDEEQARFFKAFVKEMMSWPTAYAREMQLISVAKHLTAEERELLTGLCYSEDSQC